MIDVRRLIVIVCIASMVAGMTAVVGCGDDTGTAKKYLTTAESYMPTESEVAEFGDKSNVLHDDIVKGRITNGEQLESRLAAEKQSIEAYEEKLKNVKTEYEKILDMKDVDDFKKIAKVRIDYVDTYIEVLDKRFEYERKLGEALLSAGGQAEQINDQTISELNKDLEETNKLVERKKKLSEELAELMKEKGFEH